jgi:hypothetical protein
MTQRAIHGDNYMHFLRNLSICATFLGTLAVCNAATTHISHVTVIRLARTPMFFGTQSGPYTYANVSQITGTNTAWTDPSKTLTVPAIDGGHGSVSLANNTSSRTLNYGGGIGASFPGGTVVEGIQVDANAWCSLGQMHGFEQDRVGTVQVRLVKSSGASTSASTLALSTTAGTYKCGGGPTSGPWNTSDGGSLSLPDIANSNFQALAWATWQDDYNHASATISLDYIQVTVWWH